MHPNHKNLATACSNSFSPAARGAKLAVDTPAQTQSCSAKLQFDGVVGADGTACIYFNPSPWNDRNSIWFSSDSAQSNYAGPIDNSVRYTKFGDPNTQARVVRYNKPGINGRRFSALPYNSELITPRGAASSYYNISGVSWSPPALRARVVSGSYKVTFSGSTLNDQGIFYNFTEPNHENLFGQILTNYASAFTSLKAQRIATRGIIENTVVPVQRQQMELSQGYEANQTSERLGYSISWDNGVLQTDESASDDASRTGVLIAPLAAQSVTNDFALVVNSIQSCPASQGDWQMYLKAFMTTLYPLSRSNACTVLQPESNNDGTNVGRSLSVAATGVITWTAFAPEPGIYLVKMGISGTSFAGPQSIIALYNTSTSAWNAFDLFGLPIYQTLASTQATLVGGVSFPPVIAGTIMQGLEPGSTFHVEAVIHCEYSGSQNQGLTQPCVPDPIHQGIILQAVSNARELAAKSEHARPQDAFVHSVVQTAAHHAPELATAVVGAVAPEALPMVAPMINMLQSFTKKRKL